MYLLFTILLTFFTVGCERETTGADNKISESDLKKSEILERHAEYLKSGKRNIVDHLTLEEFNTELESYGLEPYLPENREKINPRSTPPSCLEPADSNCTLIEMLADFDGNGNINTLDIYLNNLYVINNGIPGSTGTYYGGYVAPTDVGGHPANVEDWGFLSWAGNSSDTDLLRDDWCDEEVVRDFILGRICDY